MALVGLKRAAELAGKNQSTIHRAMKAGRLSYTQSGAGERLVDTAELHRLFPIAPEAAPRNDAPDGQRKDTHVLLQQRIDALETHLTDLRGERDDLRRRLDRAEEERRQAHERVTALLSDRRPSEARRRWWRWLINR